MVALLLARLGKATASQGFLSLGLHWNFDCGISGSLDFWAHIHRIELAISVECLEPNTRRLQTIAIDVDTTVFDLR